MPIAVYDMAAKIKKARHELETRSGEAVSDEQLSEAVGLSVTRINRALQVSRRILPLFVCPMQVAACPLLSFHLAHHLCARQRGHCMHGCHL